jgi:hypothetical protein
LFIFRHAKEKEVAWIFYFLKERAKCGNLFNGDDCIYHDSTIPAWFCAAETGFNQ